MDVALVRHIEAALGLESGSLRGGGWRLRTQLSAEDYKRLRTWAKGQLTRQDLGVFVYNHWLDRKGPGLYKSRLATVRMTQKGWEASVRGMTTHGTTAREAAEKLSAALSSVITLADTYREVTRAARRPSSSSGAGGSRRSSPRGRGRKG